MRPRMSRSWLFAVGLLPFAATAALGQGFSSGSTGADGALTFAPNQGSVAFVPSKAVYNFTTITVGAGTTVTLKGSGTPVTVTPLTWLASGDVTIAGTLDLSGDDGHSTSVKGFPTRPGYGGWPGGQGADLNAGTLQQNGSGPGGGVPSTGGGAALHLTGNRRYGNRFLLPLLGGSGGAGGSTSSSADGSGGGGGGGALLIACSGTIDVSGSVQARGGNAGSGGATGGGGSGGAIRFVANVIQGAGFVDVSGGFNSGSTSLGGSRGRIRLEAPVCTLTDLRPDLSSVFLSSTPGPLTPPPSTPTVRLVEVQYTDVNGVAVTLPVTTNNASSSSPDVSVATNGAVTFVFEGNRVPNGSTGRVHFSAEEGGSYFSSPTLRLDTVSGDVTRGSVVLQLTGNTGFPNGFTRVFYTVTW